MARVKRNIITEGLSGKLSDLVVFKQVKGKTLVTKAPKKRTVPLSAKQQVTVNKFALAMQYAKKALSDEHTRSEYQAATAGGQRAVNIAIADYFQAPVIHAVFLSPPDSRLLYIKATDNFKVAKVEVFVQYSDGETPEKGAAILTSNDQWIYHLKSPQLLEQGSQILVMAFDLPGNKAIHKLVL